MVMTDLRLLNLETPLI